jgi:hypothetical protein
MGLPRIIGITGYARHGKDTIASVLVRELGYSRVALADRMKELMLRLDPFIEDPFGPDERLSDIVGRGGWEEAKDYSEVRRLLQVFGTEVGREGLGEDVWIEALAKSTKGFYGNERKVVIPDIRFTNEAAFIRRMHGEVWGVSRPNFDNGLGANGTHASERDIPLLLQGADLSFVNNQQSAASFADEVFRRVKHRAATLKYLDPEDGPEIVQALVEKAREENREALDKLADS